MREARQNRNHRSFMAAYTKGAAKEGLSLHQAALRIEALKGARKSYWQTPSELWARSFEAYVQDALSAKGESSPWLVHGTRTRDQHDPLVSAYPDGEQRQRLQQLWSACMEVLRGG